MGSASSNQNKIPSNGTLFTVNGRSYQILNVIGQGGEATVYRCVDRNGFQHAVKVFFFSRYPPVQARNRIEGFKKEGQILKYLSGRSPHFIHLVDYEYIPKENIGYMIMELGDGSLRQYLRGLPLNDRMRRTFWKQIVGILKALDEAHIVHADIKPDNIILVNNVLKITDLGLAFGLSSSRVAVRRPIVRGTLDYMAPEVFSHKTGYKSDVWSAGVILYEMTYGRPPYFGVFDKKLKVAAISAKTPINFPPLHDPHLSDCIRQCLRFDSRYRPSSDYLLAHPYTKI